jgi:transposase
MEGHLLMSGKERERLKTLSRVKRGELKIVEAAELMGVCQRQARRQYKRYRELGDRGLIHRGRGRPSNRGFKAAFKEQVLARYRERYPDFGPTLASEKLATEGLTVDEETLRRWLLSAGLWQQRRKRKGHRSQRERRAHFGELVQLDGSHHEWFEKRRSKCCLMKLVDDATNQRHAHLDEEETIVAAMTVLWQWIDKHGIPRALYTDKKNVYVADEKSRQRAADSGVEVLTQFGRACKKLGIELITAHSPQAKGRVERSHALYQDRLVKELRLEQCDTIAGANELLTGTYGTQLSERFVVEPRAKANYHRSAKGIDLAAIFCIEEERQVSADWIVRFANQFFQLQPRCPTARAKGRVLVQRYLNGELHFRYQQMELSYTLLPAPPAKKHKAPPARRKQQKYVPPKNHPWRGFLFGKGVSSPAS